MLLIERSYIIYIDLVYTKDSHNRSYLGRYLGFLVHTITTSLYT